ncbi:MAG: hypothetical protein AAGK38_07335 [Pseudomonadota bacterium]
MPNLSIELSDEEYADLQERAEEKGVSPDYLALELVKGGKSATVETVQVSEEMRVLLEERLKEAERGHHLIVTAEDIMREGRERLAKRL